MTLDKGYCEWSHGTQMVGTIVLLDGSGGRGVKNDTQEGSCSLSERSQRKSSYFMVPKHEG